MIIDSYERLRDFVASQRGSRTKIVSIDGAMGSGKTTLAMMLARDLEGIRVSSDCYTQGDISVSYVDRLAHSFLADDLQRLQEVFPVVLFEGICARDTLNRLGKSARLSIYVKEVTSDRLWHFGYHLDDFLEGNAHPMVEQEPHRSEYEYHVRVRPHETSDVTYERAEE